MDSDVIKNNFNLKWILTTISIVTLLLIVYVSETTIPRTISRLPSEELQEVARTFLIDTPGCKIVDLKPFERSILNCIFLPNRPVCNNGTPPLLDANDDQLFILNSSLEAYKVENISALKCCYFEFWRLTPGVAQDDTRIQYSKRCKFFNNGTRITKEFIHVLCLYKKKNIYRDYFAFVPLKPNLTSATDDNQKLNVLVIGLDAVARLNLYRQLPLTTGFLKNISAVEMLGYNKLGDNTFLNLIAALGGLSEDEINNGCWSTQGHFDNCSFVWEEFKKNGYVTSYGENKPWMGLFHYLKKGFRNQPTDYMYSYFNYEAERVLNSEKMPYYDVCVGSRDMYQVTLKYINKFTNRMHKANKRYFAFFWETAIGHDYLNLPSIGDRDYFNFFKEYKESDRSSNTILIFMSDHGMRWGDIRDTYQGLLEERLPFLFFLLPDWFKYRYPLKHINLLKNTGRLTTHFDLHETLRELSDIRKLNVEGIKPDPTQRGCSLFTEIAPSRTCEDAGIPSHWCTCQQSHSLSISDPKVVQVANYILAYINTLLESSARCAKLSLASIKRARSMSNRNFTKDVASNFEDYMVVIETLPGEGIFESTVREYKIKDNSGSLPNVNRFEVIGTVSRLNLYGTQSYCITSFRLKLYCY